MLMLCSRLHEAGRLAALLTPYLPSTLAAPLRRTREWWCASPARLLQQQALRPAALPLPLSRSCRPASGSWTTCASGCSPSSGCASKLWAESRKRRAAQRSSCRRCSSFGSRAAAMREAAAALPAPPASEMHPLLPLNAPTPPAHFFSTSFPHPPCSCSPLRALVLLSPIPPSLFLSASNSTLQSINFEFCLAVSCLQCSCCVVMCPLVPVVPPGFVAVARPLFPFYPPLRLLASCSTVLSPLL